MRAFALKTMMWVISGVAVCLTGCGGVTSASPGGGKAPITPTVSVTPGANSISIDQALPVTVTVSGGAGAPDGTVTLASGSYVSTPVALNGGAATISVGAGKLPVGANTLTVTFTPATSNASSYTTSTGTARISVTVASPLVKISPAASTIATGQSLVVAVAVAGYAGGPVPAGTVTLSAGIFNSGAAALSNGGASITIPAGSMAAGTATLSASYSPDSTSAAVYAGASKTVTETVTPRPTPTISVSPAVQSLNTSQSLAVAIKVNPPAGSAIPTGTVVLSSGNYQSGAAILANGTAGITMPAYSLVAGSRALNASFTPDAAASEVYGTVAGSATVTVSAAVPAVTVTPDSLSINTGQTLNVAVSVTGPGSGAPLATGTVKLTSGGYASAPATLTGGNAVVVIPAGAIPAGSPTFTATYSADADSSPLYSSATGTSAAVTVITLSTIAINESTSIAPVSDQLLGMNLAAWYDVVGNSSAVNSAFSAAGIKAIRWPGGSWSDAWHWRTSATNLLPYMCNTSGAGTAWGGYSSFAAFVTSVAKGGGYDLALTANYGSNAACNGGGDPTEAAAWASEAVREGYAPSHMTVGNENFGNWEFDLHVKKNDPTTYADAVTGSNGYYALIKAASPTTAVGVVVDGNANISPPFTPNWDSIVLSRAKGAYDFVEYHFYPKDPGEETDTYLVHTAAQDLTTELRKITSELATAGAPNTPIYVGEMGSVASNPGKQSWSITQGLYAGQALGEMMNAGVARATWWMGFGDCNGTAGNMGSLLYGWQPYGAYNVFSDADPQCPGEGSIGTLSPTARAFQLFRNLAVTGEHALSTTVNGDPANIRAYSATHSGGVAVLLFNLNQTQSEPVTLTFSSSTHSAGISIIAYDKALYDQSNPASSSGVRWLEPTTTDLPAQDLPLTLTLTPWSMNAVILKP